MKQPQQEICSQKKKAEIFKNLPNVFGITDGNLVLGYDSDGKDDDSTLSRVLEICRQVNLKLNKDKCHFRCTQISFFGEVLCRHGMKPDTWKLTALTEMPSPKIKREVQVFLGIINYLSKLSPSTEDVCETLRRLTPVKTEWTWYVTYQKLFD